MVVGAKVIDQGSGNYALLVTTSGNIIQTATPTSVINTSSPIAVTSASGGVILSSGVVISITMKSLFTNSGDIYVGGSGSKPFSGFGHVFSVGDFLSLDIDNYNKVYVAATVSGDKISYIGVD